MEYIERERGLERRFRIEAIRSIPKPLKEVFPEISEGFLAEVVQECGIVEILGTWICKYEENEIVRWRFSEVCDLSTEQIIKVLSFYGELEEIDISLPSSESFERELARRSLLGSRKATEWMAENFDKYNSLHLVWMKGMLKIKREKNLLLEDLFPSSSRAMKFVKEESVTGEREQWKFLPALPAFRKEIRKEISYKDIFFLPSGEKVAVEKIPGGGYFRIREDGRCDMFLKRGSRELGDKGWLWVLINPKVRPEETVEAAIDPLDNYSALTCEYTPFFERISEAYFRATGHRLTSNIT